MNIKIGDKLIRRYTGKEKWIQEAERNFAAGGHRKFWNRLFKLDEQAWEFVGNNETLPPKSLLDFIKPAKPSNIKYLNLLPTIFKSIKSEAEKHNILKDTLFKSFLEEQLLITTQNRMDDAPILTSAMGLTYPSETYYPYGGMHKPAKLMLEKFKEAEGEISLKKRVTSIQKEGSHYKLKTSRGKVFYTKNVISNIPIWNMAKITSGDVSEYFSKLSKKFTGTWGSFTINFGVKVKKELETVYYQIHTDDKIPNCVARSFFVSLSEKDDTERAPQGWRSVTISTHTKAEEWFGLPDEEYQKKKAETKEFILKKFDNSFQGLLGKEKKYLLSGTPKTYEFCTHRENGYVGGIPHSVTKNLLSMPPNVTPFDGLYMVGDTVFPGQGTPAVVLGALNVVSMILK